MVLSKPHLSARDARRYRRLQGVIVILLLAVVLLAGFYLGQRAVQSGLGVDAERYQAMQQALEASDRELARLQAELDVQTARHQMDQQALELVTERIH